MHGVLAVHHILTQNCLPSLVVNCCHVLAYSSFDMQGFFCFLFIHRPFVISGVTCHLDKLVICLLLLLGTKTPMKSHEGPWILHALVLSFHLICNIIKVHLNYQIDCLC